MRQLFLMTAICISFFEAKSQTLQEVTNNGSGTTNNISINSGAEGVSLIGYSYLSFRNVGNTSRAGYIQHDGSNLVVNADIGNIRLVNNVGIGTLNPLYKLDVSGEGRIASTIITSSNSPFLNSTILFSQSGFHNMFGVDGTWTTKYFGMKTDGDFVIIGGNVGIGTTDPKGYKLAINGKICAHEIKIETANWPDYVFAKDYSLLSLLETEKHIKEKGHLPGIPSAAEVKANGIDLGEMNAKLLQKIEELTLHLIRIEKDNKEMKQLIKFQDDKYSKEINNLKSRIR